MGISTSIVIPTEQLTLTDQRAYRDGAIKAAISRAVKKAIASSEDQFMVRAPQPILDFGCALDQWNTAALAAVGTQYSVFQAIGAPTLAANKLCVFYKVGIETVPLPICRLTFRSGGAAGNVIYDFDCEQLVNALVTEGYFSQPVVYDPTTPFAVQAMCRIATGVLARVQLGGFIVEPKGQTIS